MPSFSLYLAFSGWSADWHSNLVSVENYHSSGKVEEKVIILASVDVYFDFDEAILTKEAQVILKRSIQILKKKPKVKVRIAGYTSASGTDPYNQRL